MNPLRKRDQLDGVRVLSRTLPDSLVRPYTEKPNPCGDLCGNSNTMGASSDHYNMDVVDDNNLVDTVLFKNS